jgi:hypothetical protein
MNINHLINQVNTEFVNNNCIYRTNRYNRTTPLGDLLITFGAAKSFNTGHCQPARSSLY